MEIRASIPLFPRISKYYIFAIIIIKFLVSYKFIFQKKLSFNIDRMIDDL